MKFRSTFFAIPVIAAVFFTAGFISFGDGFAPEAELWSDWQAHDPDSSASVDAEVWGDILSRYLQTDTAGVARFAYGEVTRQDSMALDGLIESWSAVPITDYSREEQLAYWINLYNALTVQLVLEHYPVDSIQDINISGFFSSGPWDAERIEVESLPLTLNDIEHRILRPIWKDPRLHYALNCASIGCPNLRNEVWRAGDIDAALDAAARDYVNDPRGFHIDAEGNAIVSKIYAWFVDDFGGDEAGVLRHLKSYAVGATATELESLESIHGSDYDWNLNVHPAQ